VIGNSNYQNRFIDNFQFDKLRNPVNDACDMASVLRGLGFEVILKTDVKTKRALKKAVLAFRQRLPNKLK
jgi:uncharacterized caspase-like protein